LEFVERRQCWRGDRVYYFDEVGGRSRIPAEWTSVAPVDAFVVAAEGGCPFRTRLSIHVPGEQRLPGALVCGVQKGPYA
jgi:hypothetical protein